ncbi:MAG: ABC transporter ATP-binding protein/permease [Oscillospiraceae bacterium]|jgi:ATP-binding cassette subfamily B protein|nr:ABC transporter ATP-binding protein/permease [Oscillospiraceae bacterium]
MTETVTADKRKYTTWQLINWARGYLKPYKNLLILDLFFTMLGTLSWLIFPQVIKIVLQSNEILENNRIVVLCMVILLVSALISSLGMSYSTLFGHKMGFRMENDLRRDLFSHIQYLPFSYFDRNKIGQLISRITTDLKDVGDITHHFIIDVASIILKAIGAFIILLKTNVPLTLIVFSVLGVVMLFIMYFNKMFHKSMLIARQKMGELNASAEDSLLGIKTAKAFGNEGKECFKFKKSSDEFLKSRLQLNIVISRFVAGMVFVEGLVYVAVVGAGIFFIRINYICAADLMGYVLYVDMLVDAMFKLTDTIERMQEGVTSVLRVKSVLDKPTERSPKALKKFVAVKGEIEFENVRFYYDGANDAVLNGLDIHIKAGEKVAFVGISGIGKSTLCNLIPRFYDVSEGRILIDGVDTKTVTKESLRANIGIIQQDIYLFAGTIAENIAYAKERATMEEIVEAAKRAGADEFISKMEREYQTQVGERGSRLSGGQKQRISIARTFLKNAPILILDEATSALDTENELIVQNSLKDLCKGRTTISIAQRLSTIKDSDKIFVLSDGKIAEEGTHEELLAKNGIYKQLYKY